MRWREDGGRRKGGVGDGGRMIGLIVTQHAIKPKC